MAHKKSTKKRIITNEISRQRNVARKSEIRTMKKKVVAAIKAGDLETARGIFSSAEKKIARAWRKGVLKKNTAARNISRLAQKISKAQSV
jgi:small subunit ribosomal protein S20